jgi:hypothetical protein
MNARALPRAGALPGFTGAIGTFTSLPPLLSTNHVRVGDEMNLTVVFSGKGNLARLVPPPPPVAPDWQVSSPAPGSPPRVVTLVSPTGTVVRTVAPPSLPGTFTYALRPLTARTTATPAIPFSFFDPERAVYVDLTIPSVPVTVVPDANTAGENLWAAAGSPSGETEKKLALSALATSPGRIVNSLEPLQQRRGFVLVQLLPLLAFVGLWSWDRRRRYLEQHPDVILRQRARRALRREKRALQKAWHAGDAVGIANIAVRAMRVACAPHYPAEPRALVCRDVLEVLGAGGGNGDVVRQFFAVTDASDFSATATDARALLALRAELDRVLQELEARL